MRMKDKIAPYVEQGLTAKQIHVLHPEWNYNTIYYAMNNDKVYRGSRKIKKVSDPTKKKKSAEEQKGWNANRKACKTCKYRGRGSSATSSQNGCNYILIEGHSRGCSVEECNRYIKGKQVNMNPRAGWNALDEDAEMEY